MLVSHVWGTYDLVVFKIILACKYRAVTIAKNSNPSIRLGLFRYLVFKVILKSFCVLFSKWSVSQNSRL